MVCRPSVLAGAPAAPAGRPGREVAVDMERCPPAERRQLHGSVQHVGSASCHPPNQKRLWNWSLLDEMKMFCLSFDEARWRNVPACVQMSARQCNVTLAGAADQQGCMMLRVHAVRRGLKSEPVEACSSFGEELLP